MEIVLLLIVGGAVLIFLETMLPGLIAGILGFCCVVSGVVLAYMRFDLRTANLVLAAVLLGLTAGTLLYFRYFPESRTARLFVSKGTVGELGVEKPELLHQTGTALTPLRPSGTALINSRRVDVVSEGPLIQAGTPIRVMVVEGSRVVVRALNDTNSAIIKTKDKPYA